MVEKYGEGETKGVDINIKDFEKGGKPEHGSREGDNSVRGG